MPATSSETIPVYTKSPSSSESVVPQPLQPSKLPVTQTLYPSGKVETTVETSTVNWAEETGAPVGQPPYGIASSTRTSLPPASCIGNSLTYRLRSESNIPHSSGTVS